MLVDGQIKCLFQRILLRGAVPARMRIAVEEEQRRVKGDAGLRKGTPVAQIARGKIGAFSRTGGERVLEFVASGYQKT